MTEIQLADHARNVGVSAEAKSDHGKLYRDRMVWGWIFITPWIVGFLAFIFIPMVASFLFTFTDFNLNHPEDIRFIGLGNYEKLANDPKAHDALETTLLYMTFALPISIVLPLSLALLLNSDYLWGKTLFRTLFYMPFLVPSVAIVGIWNGFLNPQSGWLNRLIESVVDIQGPDWINSVTWIYPSLLLMGVWGSGNAMLVMLAGLQGVPTELYEAAKVDGAGPFTRLRVITIPMISPVIFYNLILSTIGIFRYFDIPYMLNGGTGHPGGTTYFYNVHLYKEAFTFQNMGYGATLAWFLFLIAMTVTVALFATARYWVYYAGGEER